MSDYFGALMNLSGLGDRTRGPVAPNAPDAGGDIMESEVVREAVAPAAPADRPPAAAPPITRGAAAGSAATERAATERAVGELPLPAPAAAELRPAKPAPARRTTEVVPAAAVAAPMAAEPHHAIVRAALQWVASNPHTAADRLDLADEQDIVALPAPAEAKPTGMSRPGAASPAREQGASATIEEVEIVGIGTAPRLDVPHRLVVADAETATTGASAPANAAPPARFIGTAPAASGRVAPTVADETVEISIGAIHVRVDAPVPQAPAAPAPAAHMSSARSAAGSALSRRALRRF